MWKDEIYKKRSFSRGRLPKDREDELYIHLEGLLEEALSVAIKLNDYTVRTKIEEAIFVIKRKLDFKASREARKERFAEKRRFETPEERQRRIDEFRSR